MEMTRREALAALAAGSATALLSMGGSAQAQQSDTAGTTTGPRVAPGKHELVPLPFDPKKLRGLSERLLVSHHENNYAGALKNLNKVEEQLATVTAATPGFVVSGKGNAESLNSASHGAGRVMSRKAANEKFNWKDVNRFLRERGVTLISAGLDEVPMAYKNIGDVMRAQSDLVTVLGQFDPKLVKMAPSGERPED